MEEYVNFIKTKTYDIISRRFNSDENFKNYLIKKTNFLDENSSNSCRIWHIKNEFYYIPKCPQCGDSVKFSRKNGKNKGYNKYCSHSCKITYINLNRSEEDTVKRKNKIKETCIKKYGEEHYFSSDVIKKKKTDSFIEKYGVDNPSKLGWVQNKKIQTLIKNYGVDNPSKSVVIQSKKSLKTKSNVYNVMGKTFNLEGYEIFSLKELLDLYDINDILHHDEIEKELGVITYEMDGKNKIYHPDFYIKSENKIIEVKSLYWFNRDLEKNTLKKHHCILKGINFEFWVYDHKNHMKKVVL